MKTVMAALALSALMAAQDRDPRWLLDHGRAQQARTVLEQRVRDQPQDAGAYTLLARTLLQFGNFDAAITAAEKAVALNAQSADAHWVLAEAVGSSARRANVFKQLGLGRRYRSEADATLALNPNHLEALNGLMMFYANAPRIAGGSRAKADEMAARIGKISAFEGYLAQARLAQLDRQLDRMEALLIKAAETDATRVEPHTSLANLYWTASPKKLDLAEKHARVVLTLDRDRVAPYTILAGVFATREQWAELDRILTESEQRNADNLWPRFRAANALDTTGKDLKRAETYIRTYLAQPFEPTAPTHAVAQSLLGLILEKQGRTGEAIAAQKTAIQLDPGFEQAKDALKRLSR